MTTGRPETLLLSRRDVAELLSLEECVAAVEEAFRMHARGETLSPAILGVAAEGGGFHVKAAGLRLRGRGPLFRVEDVRPGTFLAAVGADSHGEQELDPRILGHAKVVVDSLDQCAEIGELQHALAAGLVSRGDVHAELAEILDDRKPGRTSADEITVFDSTGTALEDVAAAAAVYEKAVAAGRGTRFGFSD